MEDEEDWEDEEDEEDLCFQQGHLLEAVSGYPPATKNASVRRNAAANN